MNSIDLYMQNNGIFVLIKPKTEVLFKAFDIGKDYQQKLWHTNHKI